MSRKQELVDVGARLAAKHGAVNITRRMVAQAANVSEPLVSHYCGSTKDAQKLYARRCKALGLQQPDKAQQKAIGDELRKHKVRPSAPENKALPRAPENKSATAARMPKAPPQIAV